ncbi:MAG: cation diffusion facilitator family transporter [Oscillospiraceae bacterium]|nr:cation diffusion facilitator family transporter [Oscillospiraceae bacterium]
MKQVGKNDPQAMLPVVMRVSAVTLAGNILLMVMKLLSGLLGHSGAMLSDAVHTASDVFSTLIVMVGVRLSQKAADAEHPYGHERMECAAAILLAGILALTGLGLGWNGLNTLIAGDFDSLETPGALALGAAIVSILAKEGMYRYTRRHALRVNSTALMADAWHHRSDALSSIGALIGVGGSMLGLPFMDAAASVVISLCILKAAWDIGRDALDKMVDRACDQQTEEQMRACALAQPGVLDIDLLHTRMFGSRVYVEMEIRADGSMPLRQAHAIAEAVHLALETEFPQVKHVMVHVNPTEEDE